LKSSIQMVRYLDAQLFEIRPTETTSTRLVLHLWIFLYVKLFSLECHRASYSAQNHTVNIWIPIFKVCFCKWLDYLTIFERQFPKLRNRFFIIKWSQLVLPFENQRFRFLNGPIIWNEDFVSWDFKWCLQNQIIRPWTLFHDLNTRLVQYSDVHGKTFESQLHHSCLICKMVYKRPN
jgi:hypothetical protein